MPLTTVFLGTPEAAVPTLERLLGSDHHVQAVVTAPDRPRGRGMELAAPPVKQRAAAAGIPVLQPPSLRTPEAQAELAAAGAGVFVVCAYGLILPPAVLELPRLGSVNVHFSLLPAFRGAHAVREALAYGVKVTGCTVHLVDEQVDHGPVLFQAAVPVEPGDDEDRLHGRIKAEEHRLLPLAVRLLAEGRVRVEGRRARVAEPEEVPR